MPNGQKATFDLDKIISWGKTDGIDGSSKTWVMYGDLQVEVKETKDELDELLN